MPTSLANHTSRDVQANTELTFAADHPLGADQWAIFAPIFVPLLMRLDVAPEAVLAAYRVGDSPVNAITPLNAYFAVIVSFAQKYQKDAGVGTVIVLMLPYVLALSVVWTLLLAGWYLLGLPWGLG
jgi:aminobenzoyl-glutamate transport protein